VPFQSPRYWQSGILWFSWQLLFVLTQRSLPGDEANMIAFSIKVLLALGLGLIILALL
jgi:hypothetical protein